MHSSGITESITSGKKVLCLIDGEHYPPVTRDAIKSIEASGGKIVGAVFIGGTEKIVNARRELGGRNGWRIFQPEVTDSSLYELIERAVDESGPDVVLDLSDEPVVDYFTRFRIGSVLLRKGVIYSGADFSFSPPRAEKVLTRPSISIIGTGKRVGKTAVGVYISRLLKNSGNQPVVVCMGRGGPPEPEVVDPAKYELNPETLMEVSKRGGHAASDYWEDALLGQVITVGCRRCGGGMGGDPFFSNVIEGARIADSLPGEVVVMEGSGATLPPVATDRRIVVAGAGQPIENIIRFYGEYRILISELAIVTMCEEPVASPRKVKDIYEGIKEINPDMKIALTVFRPDPLGDITGRKVFVATTSRSDVNDSISDHLEKRHGCSVVGISNNLSDRPSLKLDLREGLKKAEILLTEIKAASIDVAAIEAEKAGLDIVFLNNIPELTGGNIDRLDREILSIIQKIRG
ncbi:MAG: cyclic 2,3-diphosphoglycerate synthetase [Candidatus Latescibacteria bacterium]|nr:cyclic 2,3-diphosphoglycerate synthetase [bacterium]MBD3423219.1 cyclic 2,3-diphosphoglycerate synthetase [Candidatus Latescibacterota bacterium]